MAYTFEHEDLKAALALATRSRASEPSPGLRDRIESVIATDRERAQRAREVDNALASVRMEGLEISSEAQALFQRYVDGEVTSEELDQAFDHYFDLKYGPVRLPRHERP